MVRKTPRGVRNPKSPVRETPGSSKALRLVIAALAGLLGGREERVQVAARPVQPKTVALQETNGQTARSPTFMPGEPHFRWGRAGRWPPRLSMAIAMRASGI